MIRSAAITWRDGRKAPSLCASVPTLSNPEPEFPLLNCLVLLKHQPEF